MSNYFLGVQFVAFAEKLSDLMGERGISAYKMWKDTGLNQSMIGRWRSGEQVPAIESTEKIAKYFGVPIAFLRDEPPFDMWEHIRGNREALLHYMYLPESLLEEMLVGKVYDNLSLSEYINFIDQTIADIRLTEDGDFDIELKPWVATQKLNRSTQVAPRVRKSAYDACAAALVPVPIYGVIRAGAPLLAQEHIIGYEFTDVRNPEEYFYLKVVGDSMINAGISNGSKVLVHKQNYAEDGQIVVCLVNGDEATLKRYKDKGDMLLLMPENNAYEPIIVPKKDFGSGYAHILGVAKKVVSDL